MKINNSNLTRLDLASLYQFSSRFIKLVNKVGAAKLKIEPIFNNLFLKSFQKFDEAYKLIQKSAMTKIITDLDKSRDKITNSIIGIIKASINDIDNEVVEAATELKNVFDEFKGITKESFNKQTADTVNLLQLLKGKYSAHCEKVGLGKWITELERLNEEIGANIDLRGEEKAEKGKFDSSEAKKEVINAFRILCNQIEVYVALEGAGNYEEFIRNLNVIIGELGRGKIKSEDDSPDTEPVEPEPDKYPNAKEWKFEEGYFKLGDICWVIIDGEKKYFEFINETYYDIDPRTEDWSLGWKKLE